jgi:uncharacterized membrane protein
MPILHAVVALPLGLLLPGYALLLALFGGVPRLDPAPALALSLLLSLACLALLSLVLNGMAIRLSQQSVLIGVDVLLLALLATIELRARQAHAPSDPPFVPSGRPVPLRPTWRGLPLQGAKAGETRRRMRAAWARTPGLWWGASLLAALSVIVATLALMLPRLPLPVDPPFTQFYLAGSWSHLDGTVQMQGARTLTVPLGVTNQTHQRGEYRVVALLDERAGWAERHLMLGTGRVWLGNVQGAIPADGCLHRLYLRLLMGPAWQVVASLNVWVQGAAGPHAACTARHG